MAEGYERFAEFDWSDERWQAYVKNLYPPPVGKKLQKFKKKWYKKTIDPDFDESFEPLEAETPAAPESAGNAGGSSSSSTSLPKTAAQSSSLSSSSMLEALTESSRWKRMGTKALICGVVYALTLTISVGAASGVFPPYQALVLLAVAFLLELFAKHGVKLSSAYVQALVLDDVGPMPLMAFTLLMPGLDHVLRVLAMVPSFLTAVLSFSHIAKEHPQTPRLVRDFFAPLADTGARYQIMQARAYVEVGLGFLLFYGVFVMRAAPFPVVIFWNFMMMRYLMNPWTQATFKSLDGYLKPKANQIPGVRQGYAKLQDLLYGFVDPNSKRFGKLCSVL